VEDELLAAPPEADATWEEENCEAIYGDHLPLAACAYPRAKRL